MASTRTDAPHPEALHSSRVLVIGGTSGIGFAVTSGALAAGSTVFVTSSSAEKVSKTLSRLGALYPNAKVSGAAADLSDFASVESNVQRVLDEAVAFTGGPLDHIVNTSGFRWTGPKLDEVTPETTFNQQVQTLRLIMPLMIAKFVAKYPGKYLSSSSKSSFTVTSGVLVKKPMPGMSTLVMVGAALEGLTRSLSVDLKPIRVNVVTPGAIATELLDGHWAQLREKFAKATLVQEVGNPWDCAEAYLFCMRSRFMSAQEVVIDGGAMAMGPL